MPCVLTGDWPVASASGAVRATSASRAGCRPLPVSADVNRPRRLPRRLLPALPTVPALAIVFIVKYTLI